MSLLLAPLLAQLVTLGAGARAEARDVQSLGQHHFEGTGTAGVGLAASVGDASLSISYAPAVTFYAFDVPTQQTVVVSDSLFAGANLAHTFTFRRSSFTIGQSGTLSITNPALQALSAPAPGAATPVDGTARTPPTGTGGTGAPATGTGGTGAPTTGTGGTTGQAQPPPSGATAATTTRPANGRLMIWTARTQARYEHAVSRTTQLGLGAAYTLTGGVDSRSQDQYPLSQGPDADVRLSALVTPRDTLTTTLNGQYRFAKVIVPGPGGAPIQDDTRTHAELVLLGESWIHDFSRRTRSQVGAGVAYSRSWRGDSAVLNSIYPAGVAGLTYTAPLARGRITLGINVAAGPVIDAATLVLDPRLGVAGTVAWTRRRWTLSATTSSAVSIGKDSSNGDGTLHSMTGSAVAHYALGSGFGAEAGVRAAWQKFQSATFVNPTTVIFAGLTWGGGAVLLHPRGQSPSGAGAADDDADRAGQDVKVKPR